MFSNAFISIKALLHRKAIRWLSWCVGCCCLPSGGPTASGWVPAVFSNYFLSPPQHREVMLPENKLILSSASVASPLRRDQGPRSPQRRTEFWRCLMRSEQSHLCLIFRCSLKVSDPSRAQRRLGHLIFVYFYFPTACSLQSSEPFRLEILAFGLINTINYCWLMKKYGHGGLAVFSLQKNTFHRPDGEKLLFTAGIWLCIVTQYGDSECVRITFQFDLEDTNSFVTYSINPIRTWLVAGLNQCKVNNLFNHSWIKRFGNSHQRVRPSADFSHKTGMLLVV